MKRNIMFFIISLILVFEAFSQDDELGTYGLIPKKITASSVLLEKDKSEDFYSAKKLCDSSYKSWVEGVAGDGIGETVSFEFEKPVNITGIGIRNGYGDLRYYYSNNRIKYFEIYVNGSYKTSFRVADTFELYKYSFLRFENVETITFKIKDVYKGFKYEDTCVNEIYFYTDFNEDSAEYKEDDFTQNAKKAFRNYSEYFDTLLYTKDGTPLLLHPIDPPSTNDIWCFNDMEFYVFKNGKWNLDHSSQIFSLIRKDIEKAKRNKYQILFSFREATGYEGSLYAYVLQVTAPSYTIYEYDFDGISFKTHDIEYKVER